MKEKLVVDKDCYMQGESDNQNNNSPTCKDNTKNRKVFAVFERVTFTFTANQYINIGI